jgi:signal transduction histidine kinase
LRGEAEIALSAPRSCDEYADSLGLVRDEGRRLSVIVDDLFLLARADAGQQPLRPTEMYLDEVAGEAVRAVRSLAARREIRVVCEVKGDFPFRGDEQLLHRLLLNLLDNALKYSPPCSTVHIGLERQGGEYRLAVRDAGPPIPPAAAARIFERFYRVDKARSRAAESATGGAGLGLSIARWVAEAHGGSLTLARSGADGNVFELRRPAPGIQPG